MSEKTVEMIIQEIERRLKHVHYENTESVSHVEYVVLKELLSWITEKDENEK